jgi:hypothetical protein
LWQQVAAVQSQLRRLAKTPLDRSVYNFAGAGILTTLLANQTVTLGAKFIHLRQHPAQKFLSRNRAYPGPLKVPNLPSLAVSLPPPIFDFPPDVVEVHGLCFSTKREQMATREGQGVPLDEHPVRQKGDFI